MTCDDSVADPDDDCLTVVVKLMSRWMGKEEEINVLRNALIRQKDTTTEAEKAKAVRAYKAEILVILRTPPPPI